jgi:two-component system NarL family sensor kinase
LQIAFLVLGAITLVVSLAYALALAFRGDARARILLVPMGGVIFPGLALVVMQRIFGAELPFVGAHLLEIVLFLEALLFSLALAYRIRLAREHAAQADTAFATLEREGNARLLQAIDQERSRIAAELHDTAGQGLLAISNRLSRLANDVELPVTLRGEIEESEEFSRTIVDDIRRISHDLHPATLDHLGLQKAIAQLVRQLNDTARIPTRFEYDLNGSEVSMRDSVHLFRIAQELIANVAKHSSARSCQVRLVRQDGQVVFEIGDDGRGLSAANEAAMPQQGIGLEIVRQRVQALLGTMSIAKGTSGLRVSIAFPARNESRDARQ